MAARKGINQAQGELPSFFLCYMSWLPDILNWSNFLQIHTSSLFWLLKRSKWRISAFLCNCLSQSPARAGILRFKKMSNYGKKAVHRDASCNKMCVAQIGVISCLNLISAKPASHSHWLGSLRYNPPLQYLVFRAKLAYFKLFCPLSIFIHL